MIELMSINGTNVFATATRVAYGYAIRLNVSGRESVREVREVNGSGVRSAIIAAIADVHGEREVYRATLGLGTRSERKRLTAAIIDRAARDAAAQLAVADALDL